MRIFVVSLLAVSLLAVGAIAASQIQDDDDAIENARNAFHQILIEQGIKPDTCEIKSQLIRNIFRYFIFKKIKVGAVCKEEGSKAAIWGTFRVPKDSDVQLSKVEMKFVFPKSCEIGYSERLGTWAILDTDGDIIAKNSDETLIKELYEKLVAGGTCP